MQEIKYKLGLDEREFTGGMKQAQAQVRALDQAAGSSNLGALSGELQMVSGRTSTFSSRMAEGRGGAQGFFSAISSGTGPVAGLVSGLGGASVVVGAFTAAIAGSRAILLDYAPYDSAVRGLSALEGGAVQTKARLEEMRQVAKLPGLGFEEAVKGDIRLRNVGLTADLSKRSMMAVGNAIASVGGGKQDLDGVTLALTQMAAKGVISAEEINQIAERMPQVRAAMKAAFGTSDTEALQKMGMSSTEFISGLVGELEKLPTVTGGAGNAVENFDDSWKQLRNTAEEFIVGTASGLLNDVAGGMNQATKLARELQEALGFQPDNLTSGANVSAAITERRRAREAEAEAAEAAAKREREAEDANFAFWERKRAEQEAAQEKQAQKKEELEKRSAERIAQAQMRVNAAGYTERENAERRIKALERQGAGNAEAINAAGNTEYAAQLAEKTAELYELRKRIADLDQREADQLDNSLRAAGEKADAAKKEADAKAQAAGDFNAESALLEAKLAGNDKLVEKLERQQKVEEAKRQIMREQGVSAEQAARMAERRVGLEEALEKGPRRGLASAEDSQRRRYDRLSEADRNKIGSFENFQSRNSTDRLGNDARRRARDATDSASGAVGNGGRSRDAGKDNTSKKLSADVAKIAQSLSGLGLAT